ncbi:MAG: Gfo/Idh/MocA family oxidoreductase [Anaerolineae bacterium]|nr:Gfo/Idh/MocA family oxidoreductase [Anaerolineae bacterium]
MADSIRWGILSTANIGRERVIPAMQQTRNGRVVAVASRSLDRAHAFADDLGIPTAYGSYEELIASPDVDAIYNPLPNSEHAEWSIRCAEAGKPTLCEKPLARNAAEAQRMVDAFAERGVLFAEAFMYRFHPQSQRVKQMLDDGAVGDVRAVQAAFSFPIRSEDDIRLSKPLAGGSLMDVGCYCVNVMRFLLGSEPTDARALAVIGAQSQVDETLTGILAFPGGALGHFDSSFRADFAHTYSIRGTRGTISVNQAFVMSPNGETIIRYRHDGQDEEIRIAPANSYTLMAEDFADALLNSRPPRFAPQDAVENMRVIDRLYASL